MPVRLVIRENAYALEEARDGGWTELAVLQGGAEALLSPARPISEAALEGAIERSEDWLMPHAARLRDQVLDISDPSGRLKSGLAEVLSSTAHAWSVDAVEQLFLRLVDRATGRLPDPELQGRQHFVADVLLLRELAHHGRPRQLRLP